MSDNDNDGVETFIIRIKKSNSEDIKNIDTESLIESLLQRGSFFKVEEIIKSGKKGKIIS